MIASAWLGLALIHRNPPVREAASPVPTATGPVADDFAPIGVIKAQAIKAVQAGTYTAHCGDNANGHYNSDNVVVAPGVTNAAHHLHDYVGNTTASGASTDQSLAAGPTTCQDQGDHSVYAWPVLRDLTSETTPERYPGELASDRNVGVVLRPEVSLVYSGNRYSPVTAMPEFLRMITGDAHALTSGGREERAAFTCRGYTNRITLAKYPLCPGGKGLTRIEEFPSCWDGKNTDSANHRTHVVFPDSAGRCPAKTVAIPKLTMTLTYDVPPGRSYALDTFPDQLHKPITDHADFISVMSKASMARVVECINSGRAC
jgi:hypothetical protein